MQYQSVVDTLDVQLLLVEETKANPGSLGRRTWIEDIIVQHADRLSDRVPSVVS